jgi:hypothetical protein
MEIKLVCKKTLGNSKIEVGKQYSLSLYGKIGSLCHGQNIYCISRNDNGDKIRVALFYEKDIDELFIPLAEWREQQINSILNDN